MSTGKAASFRHLKDLLNKMSDEELGARIVIKRGDEVVSNGHSIFLIANDYDTLIYISDLNKNTDTNFIT